MKKLIIIFLLLPVLTFAEEMRPLYLETLLTTYDRSYKAPFTELVGAYAGKCVTMFDRKQVVAGLLIIAEYEQKKVVIAAVNDVDGENYYYENYKAEELAEDTLAFAESVKPVLSEQPLVGTDGIQDSETHWYVGKLKTALVAKMVYEGVSGERYLFGHKPVFINSGEEYAACLYTKKL